MLIPELISQQRDYFHTNATKDVDFRISMLKKLRSVIRANEEKMYEAIDKDFGKSKFETYSTELAMIYHELNMAIKNVKKWSRAKRVRGKLANFPSKNFVIPEPLGVSLVIGAWNYPYQLSLVPVISALAAGNTVVMKPSELPARTSKVMHQLITENFNRQYFAVVEGGIPETTELLAQRYDKIFFTGSTQVGRIVYQAAAKHLTPVTLELGGKSPCFVFADCNIKIAAKRLAWSKFLNAGQTCIAPDYILVEKSIEEKFLEAFKKELDKYPQSYTAGSDNYTRIIGERHYNQLCSYIDKSKLAHGGSTDKENLFISPTVLTKVGFDDPVMQQEVFGPILPFITFTNVEEVLPKVKAMPKPLSAYIYSKDNKMIKRILKEISFGGGAINDSVMHISNSNLPFGGVGSSGMGAYHGKEGFDAFSHKKSIMKKSFLFEPSIKYAPYSDFKMKVIKMLQE